VKITELEGVGAEVTGVDLRQLTTSQGAALESAFAEQGLLIIRDQTLSERDHLAFAARWGSINTNRFFKAHPDFAEIALVGKEPDQVVNIGGDWHTDHSYDEIPALGSILVAKELPDVGGETWFVSMYRAFEGLSDGLKKLLVGLSAVHSAKHVFGGSAPYMQEMQKVARLGRPELADALSDPVHPVVVRHPLSGRPALYVNPAFTLRFDGWTEAESKPLLDYLYKAAVAQQKVYRLVWHPGTIAFWDNRATWHFAQNDYHGQRRMMHRVTVEGVPLEPFTGRPHKTPVHHRGPGD